MFERFRSQRKEDNKSEKEHSSPREQAARKQIERQLQDETISSQDREHLEQNLDQLGGAESDKEKKSTINARECALISDRVHELVNPQTGDALRALVQEKLFGGSTDAGERNASVERFGYDPTVLRSMGQEIITQVQEVDTSMNEGRAMFVRDIQHVFKLYPMVYSKQEKTKLRHSDLTVGASVMVSRQIQEMIAMSLEDDLNKRKGIIGSEELKIDVEDVKRYVTLVHTNPRTAVVRQDTTIAGLGDEEKKQYIAIRSFLDTNVLGEAGDTGNRKAVA